MPLRNVCALVFNPVASFELGVVTEVFGVNRSVQGVPSFDFSVVSGDGAFLRAVGGLVITAPTDLRRLATADLVCVPSWPRHDQEPSSEVVAALRAVVARGGTVLSVCSGAFVLAAAGLLDGGRATTHWSCATALAERYPSVEVDPDVLYVDCGQVVTGAGTAAGIDACLHIVRRELGSDVANAIARGMVVPAHRQGGQAQRVEAPVPLHRQSGAEALAAVLDWAVENLDKDLSVHTLAARAHMSERTLARRFRQLTGVTPYQWLLSQRLNQAQRLLENGASVEEAARRSGFRGAATLRAQFSRWNGRSPSEYARAFRPAG